MATIGKPATAKAAAPPTGRRRLSPRDFWRAYHRYASGAFHRVNISPWVILAQWAHETGWGSSNLAVNHHNLAGIRWYGRPGQDFHIGGTPGKAGTGFAGFRSLDEFVDDYCYVMQLGYYRKVRELWDPSDTAAGVIIPQCHALGVSPYSGTHYGPPGHPGANLVAAWKRLEPIARELHDTGHVR